MMLMSNIKPKLCLISGEKGYDPKHFHYRVERVMIDDHNVPSLEWVIRLAVSFCFEELQLGVIAVYYVALRDMLRYTDSVREWMAADSRNIIAIHCKGGKGDTTLCAVYFLKSITKTYLVHNVVASQVKTSVPLWQGVRGPWCARG